MTLTLKPPLPPRRTVLHAAAAAAAGLVLPARSQADVAQMTVGFPPGGPVDIVARLLVDAGLGEAYGRRFIVDNKPGAAGMLATRQLARAAADGKQFLLSSEFLISNAAAYEKPGYDPVKDFTPVAPVGTSYVVLVVNGKAPWRNLKDFLDHARSRGNAVAFGSQGLGTGTHLLGVALTQKTGLALNHIPYRGGAPVVQALLAEEIATAFIAYASARPHLDNGNLRVLAVATSSRQPELPDVPTLHEQGAAHALWDNDGGWFGVFAPAGTARAVTQRLVAAMATVLAKPQVVERLAVLGVRPWRGAPDSWAQSLPGAFEHWKKLVAEANVRVTL